MPSRSPPAPERRGGGSVGRLSLLFLADLWYKALDPHRRALGGEPPRGPGPQWLGHSEGKQTLSPLKSPSCSMRSKLTPGKDTAKKE